MSNIANDPQFDNPAVPRSAGGTALDERIAMAERDGLVGSVLRFLKFRGTKENEWVELQVIQGSSVQFPKVYFAHADSEPAVVALAQNAESELAPMGVFYIMNQVDPSISARGYANRWNIQAKNSGTTEGDIVERRVIMLDCDSKRARGISATEPERLASLAVAKGIYADLTEVLGGKASAVGFGGSGNGYHVMLALASLPADENTSHVVAGLIAAIALINDTPSVHVDRAVSDAKRLCPLYGSPKRKGVSTPERPHRNSSFWCEDHVARLTMSDVENLLASFRAHLSAEEQLEVDRAMGVKVPAGSKKTATRHGASVAKSAAHERAEPRGDGVFAEANELSVEDVATWLDLVEDGMAVCPGCGTTGDTSVVFVGNGLKCSHDRCAGKGVPGKSGFRTPVDLVVEARRVTPVEAVRLLADQFGTSAPGFADSTNSAKGGPASPGLPLAWGPPVPFEDTAALPAFPVSALPAPLGSWVVAEAIATQTPVDLPAMLALAVLSVAAGKGVIVRVREGWSEPINLFVVVALPSGNRKSPVFSDAVRPVQNFERMMANSAKEVVAKDAAKRHLMERQYKLATEKAADGDKPSEAEAEMLATKLAVPAPVIPRLVVDDVTSEKLCVQLAQQGGRLAMLSAEGGAFETMAGRYSDVANIDVYLKAHAGEDVRVDRVGRPSVHLKRPALTLGLAVQPDVIRGLAGKPGFRGRGLLARFFFSMPSSLVGRRDVDPPAVPADVADLYDMVISTVLCERGTADASGELVPYKLELEDDARLALLLFSDALEPRLGESGDLHTIADWASKLAGGIARIAGLMHVAVWGNAGRISEATMRDAIVIGHYLLEHARAAFLFMHADASTANARYVLSWLCRSARTTFTKRELFEAAKGRFRKAEELDPVLASLEDRGYVRRLDCATGRPGRPSRVYEVNPFFASQYSQYSQTPSSQPPTGQVPRAQ